MYLLFLGSSDDPLRPRFLFRWFFLNVFQLSYQPRALSAGMRKLGSSASILLYPLFLMPPELSGLVASVFSATAPSEHTCWGAADFFTRCISATRSKTRLVAKRGSRKSGCGEVTNRISINFGLPYFLLLLISSNNMLPLWYGMVWYLGRKCFNDFAPCKKVKYWQGNNRKTVLPAPPPCFTSYGVGFSAPCIII